MPSGVAALVRLPGVLAGGPPRLVSESGPGAGRLGLPGARRVNSPGHFAERHGLILMIALGESFLAMGVG
ncbi:hypothetical protein ABZ135_33085, partial [Streptomyces sp. NPDC006339]